jgi:hypothetical protein
MGLLLNPVFPVVGTSENWACGLCTHTTEAWVQQKRDPNADILSPILYLNGFGGPNASNNMATWMAADDEGSFYVLSRKQQSASQKPWYVLAKFDMCGNLVRSIHINRDTGFGHYLDVTPYPQICTGPQGVVIVASPAFHPNGGILNGLQQPNQFHIVACFGAASLDLRWTIATKIGTTNGFNNMHGLYSNKLTGHTYLFERFGGGGFNQGDVGLTTISESGRITGRCLLNLPNAGFFIPTVNNVDAVLTRSDGSIIVFGNHHEVDVFNIGEETAFSWNVVLSANGSKVKRNYVVSNLTADHAAMRGAGGCIRADGKILLKSGMGGSFVLNADATELLESWSGGWGTRTESSQMALMADGSIWWVETNVAPDLPAAGWSEFAPSGAAATFRIRKLSADGKTVTASKTASVGPTGLCGYATDSICMSNGRVGMLVGGWGLASCSMSGKSTAFALEPSYPGAQQNNQELDTFAKFARWSGSAFSIANTAYPSPPTLSLSTEGGLLGAPSMFDPGETSSFYELAAEEPADDVRWSRFAGSEV